MIACLPLFFAVSTPAWFVALSIFLFACVAAASTAFLAVCFSSAVNAVLLSIADFFVFAAAVISCFAAAFAVPFTGTALIACLPLFFAVSTPAWFVALSIFLFACVAAASTAFLAVCFSSAVNAVLLSIADFFVFAAAVISCFAAFLNASRSNAGLGAFGITTGSLISDAVSLVVKVLPYASLGGIPPFAIFLTVIRSFSLSALVGVHVACPFVAFTSVCFCPLR